MYKRCPFCGDCGAICEPNYDESYVRCQKCGANGPTGNFEEAGALWDSRATGCESTEDT
jgi:translation initiation factor 2 beta subunit (eIF-2beta)/eIF-5